MNVLNKGRCSRCIASRYEDHYHGKKEWSEYYGKKIKIIRWLFCTIYKKFCVHVAGFICKEPPMGISAEDYIEIMGEGNLDGEKMPGSESAV